MTRLAFALVLGFAGVALAQDAATTDVHPPQLVKRVPPEDTGCSKLIVGKKVSVMIGLNVTAKGLPDSVVVDRSSGDQCRDKHAMAMVRQYRFLPATRDGKPESTHIRIEIGFERRQ